MYDSLVWNVFQMRLGLVLVLVKCAGRLFIESIGLHAPAFILWSPRQKKILLPISWILIQSVARKTEMLSRVAYKSCYRQTASHSGAGEDILRKK